MARSVHRIKKYSLVSTVWLAFILTATRQSIAGGQAVPDTSRSTVAPVLDRIIHLSAMVSKTPTEAYAYFTENKLLESWLTGVAEVEAKVGGKYELFWQPNDRENNSTIGCRITAIAPTQLLSFQWRSPKQFKSFVNAADPLTHVTVMFIPEPAGTRVHLVHSGWRSGVEWEQARVWQEKAWAGALKELERLTAQQIESPKLNLNEPGEEHKVLELFAGIWDVTLTIPIGPNKFMNGKSRCEAKWVMDGRFLRQEYSSTFQGKPLTVVRYLGFDRHKGMFVEIHFESTHTDVMHSEGVIAEDCKTITCVGRHVDIAAAKEVTVRTVTTFRDKNTFTLQMIYTDNDGKESKTVTLTHKRKV
jgi:uncharacterized protein YndB with AHSA1/START domain